MTVNNLTCGHDSASAPRPGLTKLLEDCRAIVAALEEYLPPADIVAAIGENRPSKLDIPRKTKCPFKGCTRQDPLPTGQALREHFLSHRTRDTPEVCVYCHEVFRRPAAYITHQYKRHFRETDEIKVAFTKAIVQRLRDESESELNTALQTSPANGKKSEGPDSTAELSTNSLEDVPTGRRNTPDAQSQSATLAAGIEGSVPNGCDRRSPKPNWTVKGPVAPGKRPWLDSDPPQTGGESPEKRRCSVRNQEGSASSATDFVQPKSEKPRYPTQALLREKSSSEMTTKFQDAARNARSASRHGQNDLLHRVTIAAAASYPFTVQGKTAALKEQISNAVLTEHPDKEALLQQLFKHRSPENIEDLHRTIFEKGVGVDRRDMQAVWKQLWDYLPSSQTYISEEQLQLPRSTCISIDVDLDGDLIVSVKIGRAEGMKLLRDWKILAHLRYVVI